MERRRTGRLTQSSQRPMRGGWPNQANQVLSVFAVRHFFAKGLLDVGGDEGTDVAAEAGDFLDHAGADEGVGFLRHHENGFDALVEFAVHEGELELELEVGHSAKTANDGFALFGLDVVNEEPGERVDFNIRKMLDGAGGEVFALRHAEERSFAFVDGDGDDNAIEETCGALDHIEVTIGYRIETSRVYGGPHGGDGSKCAEEGKGIGGAIRRDFDLSQNRAEKFWLPLAGGAFLHPEDVDVVW